MFHAFGNNPIKYTDPDGKLVQIIGSDSTCEQILSYINEFSKTKYGINSSGYLYKIGTNKSTKDSPKSKEYSKMIDSAIAYSDGTIKISMAKTATIMLSDKSFEKIDVDERSGGGCTYSLFSKEILAVITGNKSPAIQLEDGSNANYSPEEILMHELVGHAIPRLLKETEGSAIEHENRIRKELHKKLRKDDGNHPVAGYIHPGLL